eukprot:comp20160_c0_seq1/m.24950 comp20160_c0_seq1/g.24950  ORF comp20160_c0_seq1/g.24950 comp20160_c0_seq1/m.24950 type:complete len:969 (-) comp20160_c0_seq1:35-2941(-)
MDKLLKQPLELMRTASGTEFVSSKPNASVHTALATAGSLDRTRAISTSELDDGDATFHFEDDLMELDDHHHHDPDNPPPSPFTSLETRSVELHVKPLDDVGDILYAARFGDVEQLKWFVLRGADLSKADLDRRTPLHVAAAEGRVGAVEFLIEQKVDVNAVDRWGNTPLEEAINNGHFETAQLIREHGGTAKHELGDRMCEYASKGDLENIKLLVQAGTNVNSKSTRSKHTALHMAAAEGHIDVVKFLLSHGAEVNIVDRWGHTPLKNALDNHHKDIVALLTQKGAQAVSYDTDALELNKACALGELHKVKALIEWRGLDVNMKDYDGRAPIHVAASEGHLDVVQYLVSKGANVEIKDRWGFNAYQNALQNGHPEIAHFLNHSAQFVLKTMLSVDDTDATDFPTNLNGQQILCCQRFGKNRSMIHSAFTLLLQQISSLAGWEFTELWTINQEWQVLQFCRESCCITPNADPVQRQKLADFAEVSKGLLIEYNIFFGGNVLTKRRPALFTRLHSLPQFNFFRSPMCRVAGLRTCLALPISPDETSDEILGAVILFSTKDVTPTDETVAPLLECISMTARLVTSLAKLPKDQISKNTYASVLLESISPEPMETGTPLDDINYQRIMLDIGALEPVFQWSRSLNSEEHKAAIDVFEALAKNAASLNAYPQWAEAKEKLLWGLRFLVSVSPADRKETPVKGIAERALKELESSGTVAVMDPPYFLHLDSPVMAALREVKQNLMAEFATYAQTHNIEGAAIEDYRSPSFRPRMMTSDVFRAFGKRETGGGGVGAYRMPMFGGAPKRGPSESDRATTFINKLLEEGVGPDLKLFTRENLLKLHGCLDLDKTTVKQDFRRQWVVGSFQFYKFYRVFSPYEEIPRAIDMVLDELNTEMRDMNGALKAYYAYHALVHFIHPFHDGNGRISRLIANIVLKAHGYLGVLTYQDKIIKFQEFLERVISAADTYRSMKFGH